MTGSTTLDDTVDDQTPASDSMADEMILMSLLLMRFSTRTAGAIEGELRDLADELVRLLTANDFTQVKMEAARTQRLRRLLDESALAIKRSFGIAGRAMVRDVQFAVEVSGEHAAKALNDTLGFDRARPLDGDRVAGLAGALLVEGKSPIEWWKKIAGDAKFRFERILQDGYQRKMGLEDMIKAIRGTGAKRFSDGVLGVSWRAAATLGHSAIAAAAAIAREFMWRDNPETVGQVVQHSRLDLRTSQICQGYSLKVWSLPNYEPVGHKLPYNGGCPRHFRCRSVILPVVKHFDQLPARFQTKIAFARREAAFNGAEPVDMAYDDWLKTQSVARQKAALGNRYALWKNGGMTLDDMLDQSGSPLSIRELRKMAGLD